MVKGNLSSGTEQKP